MKTRRGRRTIPAILAGLAVAVVLAALYVSSWRNDNARASSGPTGPIPSSVPTVPSATPSTFGRPTASASGSASPGGFASHGMSLPPGMTGNGFAQSWPKHTITLHAWSSSPIPALGWIVPTAREGGKWFGKSTNWTQTITAYGNPKYAQLYLATDYRGIRVFCTVAVDGVIKASGHSSGPYGNVMCTA